MAGALAGCAALGKQATTSSGGPTPVIVFGSSGDIFTITADGKSRRQLTKVGEGALARDPAWSPDGARIVYAYTPPFLAGRGSGNVPPLPVTDLYVMNADGSDAKMLVAHDGLGVGYETPVWAPDGQSAYVTYTALVMEGPIVRDQVVELARVLLNGGARQTVVPQATFPTVSSDGRRLAFISSRGGGRALMVADVDGANGQTLVPPGRMDGLAAPRFSPDGKHIVFSAVAPSNAGPVRAVLPERSASPASPTAIAPHRDASLDAGARLGAHVRAVAMATAGLLLARPARAHGLPMDLFMIGANGADFRRLTDLGEDNPAATWAPDGRQLAMLAGGGIYIMNNDGTEANVIDTRGGHGSSDWRRS